MFKRLGYLLRKADDIADMEEMLNALNLKLSTIKELDARYKRELDTVILDLEKRINKIELATSKSKRVYKKKTAKKNELSDKKSSK